jgi:hypothetical protein
MTPIPDAIDRSEPSDGDRSRLVADDESNTALGRAQRGNKEVMLIIFDGQGGPVAVAMLHRDGA